MSYRRPKAPETKSIFQDEESACAVKLFVSVIHRAVRDYIQYRNCDDDKQKFEYAIDAWEWFLDDDPQELMSFVSICSMLDLDPGTMRCKIAELADKSIDEDSFFLDGYRDEDRESSDEEDFEGEVEG